MAATEVIARYSNEFYGIESAVAYKPRNDQYAVTLWCVEANLPLPAVKFFDSLDAAKEYAQYLVR